MSNVAAAAALSGCSVEGGASSRTAFACRERSITPDDALSTQPAAENSCELGPITPASAPPHATVTPGGGEPDDAADPRADATLLAAALAGATQAAHDDAAAQHAAELWRRIQSFMQCLAGSPLLHSALFSLELSSRHPVAAEPGITPSDALHWTVAQLLALHLKAEYTEASERSVLASLWLLESMESVSRCPATLCLNDYLKHLSIFSQEAVLAITAEWENSFRKLRQALVDAQVDVLHRLDWRVRLDLETEVRSCHNLLFQLSRGCQQPAQGEPSPREVWAMRMHRLCAHVRQQAKRVCKPVRTSARCSPQGGVREEAQQTPIKRQRVEPFHA